MKKIITPLVKIKDIETGAYVSVPAIKGDKGDPIDVTVDGTSVVEDGVAKIVSPTVAKTGMTTGDDWTTDEQGLARNKIGIYVCTQEEYDALEDKSGLHIIVEE